MSQRATVVASQIAEAERPTEGANTGEQDPHPTRIDGSENPESGDALLENHENGPWNKEREAEAIEEREKADKGHLSPP